MTLSKTKPTEWARLLKLQNYRKIRSHYKRHRNGKDKEVEEHKLDLYLLDKHERKMKSRKRCYEKEDEIKKEL